MSEKKIYKIAEEKAFDYQRNLGMIDSVSDDHVVARRMGFYDGFIAGAEWQKEQDLAEMAQSKSPLSVAYANRCFENGKQAMKQQMLKEAVECKLVCINNSLLAVLPVKEFEWTIGDTIRIIIVKED